MILLPAAWLMAPPAVVVNENVAEMGVLDATRLGPAMANVGPSTLSPMGPESSVVHVPSCVVLILMPASTPVQFVCVCVCAGREI